MIKFCGYKAELSAIFDQFLKMPYQERVGVADKVKCLDAFRETENAGKGDEKLGWVAAKVLGRDEPIKRRTIAHWRENEKKLREQVRGLDTGKRTKKQKNLRLAECYDFGEKLVEKLLLYSSHTNLTWDIIIDQARQLQEEEFPNRRFIKASSARRRKHHLDPRYEASGSSSTKA